MKVFTSLSSAESVDRTDYIIPSKGASLIRHGSDEQSLQVFRLGMHDLWIREAGGNVLLSSYLFAEFNVMM